ncbi:hypothetical protein ACFQDN_22050 [Pseudomonas asuensis]|uniref:TraL protein n=1 Tax=Pseudomonas asuensis TaxID=1825787 RepID=A0ABQ2H2K0_9PSED|nr:hypothetical protein [Pseudomonas asuensis]GGM25668.1 hypothetical protein GCM10009425_40530 [Pseudomonas asuensis]
MKGFLCTLIVAMLCSVSITEAATCRSGEAAERGGQKGYDRDKQAAQETADRDRSSSDILGKCIGGITAVTTAPQFPSLAEIWEAIKDKVCAIASNQVHGAISEVNSQIGGVMRDINGQIDDTGVNDIGRPIGVDVGVGTPVRIDQSAKSGASSSSAFWSEVWK